MIEILTNDLFSGFFLVYGILLFTSYILVGFLSSTELSFHEKKNSHFRYSTITGYPSLPGISIIAPCFNEEKSIVENIRSLLLLNYPKAEVIIVNDGSIDQSLELAIKNYDLVKVELAYKKSIFTAPVKGIYKSRNKAYSNLIVVDKENGGKADALNAGLNISKSDLFLAVDVDCIIEQDALWRMVKPFLEEENGKKVIASGGVIRVANSCEIENGQVVKVNFPKNIWARFQVLEYFRAFTLGRMAWSKINGLLIISGAFGMFDRKLALLVDGYDRTSVGEDLELVVRMRKYMHNVEKKSYQVAFIPDPLCWTEVPTTLKALSRQRNRWTRGSIDTIIKHRNLFFNIRYGRIGLLSFPYWVFFEWLAPLVEFAGLLYFILMIYLNKVDVYVFSIMLGLVFAFSLTFSSLAVFYETYIFHRYKGILFLLKVFWTAIFEIIIFHPINVYFALSGNFNYFFRKKKNVWGNMMRTGFEIKPK